MKLEVPYYPSVKDTDCGPIVLKMVLAYFGEDKTFEEIAAAEKQLPTGMVWTQGIARAAREFGFPVKIISTTNFSHEESDIEYYKKYVNDQGMLTLKELCDENKRNGVQNEEKNMSLEELLSYVTTDSLPIVLVNWYVLAGKEGYTGHFLPVTGYDDQFVYVHNPGIASAAPYLKLKRENFQKAWEAKGTDKDTVIVFRKKES